jgi:hypothetical protein
MLTGLSLDSTVCPVKGGDRRCPPVLRPTDKTVPFIGKRREIF